jgi:four helix bundle protein
LADEQIESYRDLRVWQEAMTLAADCYRMTQRFPREEAFGMTSQIRRSAASIAANIAEGWGRDATGSFVQFLKVAQGSLKELETHLLLSERVGLSSANLTAPLLARSDDLGRMLRSYIRSLQRSENKR